MEVQADTDHDGIGDDWEMYYFGSLEESAARDFDHDGLTNAEEWALRVNPALADTDGDGVSDGDEVHEHHTDPNQTDSDGDGLSDSGRSATALIHCMTIAKSILMATA